MKTSIVQIGNSRGIRLPKTLLMLCHMTKEVILDIKGDSIVIRPAGKKSREGWDEAFKQMHDRKEDQLLIEDSIGLEMKGWEW